MRAAQSTRRAQARALEDELESKKQAAAIELNSKKQAAAIELDSKQRAVAMEQRGATMEQDTRQELVLHHLAPALAEAVRSGRCWGPGGARQELPQPLAALAPVALAPVTLAALAPPPPPPARYAAASACVGNAGRVTAARAFVFLRFVWH